MTTLPESGPTPDAASPRSPAHEPTPMPLAIGDRLTAVVMGALTLATFADAPLRYFTGSSFARTEGFSVFLMVMLALVAGSAAMACGAPAD